MADPIEAEAARLEKHGNPPGNHALHFLRNLGPGLITGAADDDPSGISTYSVAGATTGLSMLWLALITTPMMAVIQGMCARIGMVAGIGLAAQMRKTFPRWLAMALALIVIVANTFNIGADFAGMSAAAHLVGPFIPELVWVFLFGAVLLAAQVFFSYRLLSSIFKWLTLALFAYVITAFVVHPFWPDVLRHAFVPEFHKDGHWITTVVGVLGTTISPYLFFWQSSLMVEEEKDQGRTDIKERRGATDVEIKDAHADVNTGMIYSNLVMFFIITTTAVTLGAHGKHIATAQDAAQALRPLAGNFAYVLFTLGMVGTGMLAIPVLAGSSAYVAAEMLAFRTGLGETPRRAPRFYFIIGAGIVLGVLMNVIKIDPIKALFWSAVFNGVAAVPLVYAIVHLANRKDVMGRWKSSLLANIWGWATFVLMGAAAVLLFVFWNQQ